MPSKNKKNQRRENMKWQTLVKNWVSICLWNTYKYVVFSFIHKINDQKSHAISQIQNRRRVWFFFFHFIKSTHKQINRKQQKKKKRNEIRCTMSRREWKMKFIECKIQSIHQQKNPTPTNVEKRAEKYQQTSLHG